jgi:hypothetical protein
LRAVRSILCGIFHQPFVPVAPDLLTRHLYALKAKVELSLRVYLRNEEVVGTVTQTEVQFSQA